MRIITQSFCICLLSVFFHGTIMSAHSRELRASLIAGEVTSVGSLRKAVGNCVLKLGTTLRIDSLIRGSLALGTNQSARQKALMCASEVADVSAIQWLLWAGVDVNKRDPDGRTPLTDVCDLGTMETLVLGPPNGHAVCAAAEALLDARANVNEVGSDGLSPLQHAVRADCVELVQLLMNAETNFDAVLTAVHESRLD